MNEQAGLVAKFLQVVDDRQGADVLFLVQGQLLGGFRKVLSLRCDAMASMLTGEFKEACKHKRPIPLPMFDHSPLAFRMFLIYLHTGHVPPLSPADVMHLYGVSDYFMADELKATCMDFMRNVEVHESFCLQMLSFGMRHDFSDVVMKAVSFLANDADAVLSNPKEAAQLPDTLLRYIFQSSDLTVSEITLVNIVLELNTERDAELRAELVPCIRLPRVGAKEMMQVIVPSGLFDKDMCIKSLAFQLDPDSVSLPAEATADRIQPVHIYLPPSRKWIPPSRRHNVGSQHERNGFAEGFAAFLQALTGEGCSEEAPDSQSDVEDDEGLVPGLMLRTLGIAPAQEP